MDMGFDIINEKREFKLGNIITIFTIPDCDKEIVLFSIDDLDIKGDKTDLQIAFLNTDSEGNDYITEIDDKGVFKRAMEVVSDMVKVINY